jgi:hypothetical protein
MLNLAASRLQATEQPMPPQQVHSGVCRKSFISTKVMLLVYFANSILNVILGKSDHFKAVNIHQDLIKLAENEHHRLDYTQDQTLDYHYERTLVPVTTL